MLFAIKLQSLLGSRCGCLRPTPLLFVFFHDVLSDGKSYPATHPDDYELLSLGLLEDDGSFMGAPMVIFTGTQWKQAREAAEAAKLDEAIG